jgi:hypothetical protein
MVDARKAFAWFERMLTELIEEQISARRRKALDRLENSGEDPAAAK